MDMIGMFHSTVGYSKLPGQNGAKQNPYFGTSSWREPGKLAKTLPKIALVCVMTLPANPALQAALHSEPSAAVSALTSKNNAPLNASALVALVGLLYLLINCRGASLGHELGHVISSRHVVKVHGFDQLEGTLSYPVLNNRAFLQYANVYSNAWLNARKSLQKECEQAAGMGVLFSDAWTKKRERLIGMLREQSLIAEAGHLLEGYLKGYEVPMNGLFDHVASYQNSKRILNLVKPEARTLIERTHFVWEEQRRAKQAAKALLTGLERSKVQAVYESLLSQAKEGKNSWSRGELDHLLTALG